jgi:hypothetical protein
MESLRASFAASHAAYLARLAAGKQPLPPAAVRSVAGGALSFLDYTDDAALARVNAAYLLAVALLYAVMRWRGTGFELRAIMIVRPPRFAASAAPRSHRAFGALPHRFAPLTDATRPLLWTRGGTRRWRRERARQHVSRRAAAGALTRPRRVTGVQRGVRGAGGLRGGGRRALQAGEAGLLRVQRAGSVARWPPPGAGYVVRTSPAPRPAAQGSQLLQPRARRAAVARA